MNRRQKIIVSVTGIFLVLLILVGLTYAYFLTQIQGNTNTNSISVTTAKLELVYGDNSAEIIRGTGSLMPTVETDADDAIGTKTFTVTNNGNDSSYVVIIDNVSVTKASDGSSTSFVTNDFRYTLTCSVKDKSGNLLTDEKCNEVKSLSIFPINGGILVGNAILENKVHEYTLTMWYIDNGEDQSDDMNKHLQARVNIADLAQMENPFATGVTAIDNTSLAYNIIKNAKENKNGTKLLNTPSTKIAEEISDTKGTGEYVYQEAEEVDIPISEFESLLAEIEASYSNDFETACEGDEETQSNNLLNKYICLKMGSEEQIFYVRNSTSESVTLVSFALEEIIEYEKTLSVTLDDYGTSYYFRGKVEDNYVNFAGMCWRIVRIAGDGSTKLILEDQYTTCDDTETETTSVVYTGNWNIGIGNYGYEYKNVDADSESEHIMNYLNPVTAKEKSMVKSFYDFQTTKLEDYTNKLKAGDWCLGDKAYTRSGVSGSYTYTPLEEYNYSSSMYYDSYVRLIGDNIKGYQPTLKCNGTILNEFADVSGVSSKAPMYVSAITADEIVYAGGISNDSNYNYYLMNDYSKDGHYFWSLSPYNLLGYNNLAFCVGYDGYLYGCYVSNVNNNLFAFRPSVSLNTGVKITGGTGTKGNPYIIDEA